MLDAKAETVPASIYDNLPLKKDVLSTRMLTILPGRRADALDCKLRVQAISACSTYNALSYTWGEEPERRHIRVNGQTFAATINLEEALRALRHERKRVYLWADAICINQNDLDERAQQVKEMGNIFKSAHQVLVWLGPGSEDTSRAIRFIKRTTRMENESGPGICELLQHRWWTRIWVVQELAIASSDPIFYCGQDTISWSSLSIFVQKFLRDFLYAFLRGAFGHWPDGMLARLARVNEMRMMREEVKKPLRLRDYTAVGVTDDDVFKWIRRTAMFEATDPRDKIFALLGLARSKLWSRIKVDYSMSVAQLTRDLLLHEAHEQMNLDMLALCGPGRSPDNPSWLPDFRLSKVVWFRCKVGEADLSIHPFAASPGEDLRTQSSMYWDESFDPSIAAAIDWRRGNILLYLAWCQFLMRRKSAIHEHPELTFCAVKGHQAELVADGHSLGRIASIVDDQPTQTQLGMHQYAVIMPRTNRDRPSIDPAYHTTDQSRAPAMRSSDAWQDDLEQYSIRQHVDLKGTTVEKSVARMLGLVYWQPVWRALCARPGDPDLDSVHLPIDTALDLTNHRTIARAMEGRHQFLTDTGLIGLGPSEMAEGDEVVMFFSSAFAYVLRNDPGTKRHRLVGPAFVSTPNTSLGQAFRNAVWHALPVDLEVELGRSLVLRDEEKQSEKIREIVERGLTELEKRRRAAEIEITRLERTKAELHEYNSGKKFLAGVERKHFTIV